MEGAHPFFSLGLARPDTFTGERDVASLTNMLLKADPDRHVARFDQSLKGVPVSNPLKNNHEVAGPLSKPGLHWLFLATLILVLWQVPFINLVYYQAGLRTFLQAALQNTELPPHLPWLGQVEADPVPMIESLQRAGDPFVPLQMPLNADRPLGTILLLTGHNPQAEQRLLSRLENAPDDYLAQFFLGEAHRRQGNTAAAIEQWGMVGAQEPLMELARSLIEQNDKTAALAALDVVMRLDKTDTEPRWWAADILSEQGATPQALALYQEIRAINPHSEAAHRQVGAILLQQGNLEQALAVYQELIDLAPHRATGYALMGQALYEAHHYDQAVTFLEQALQRNPPEPDLLLEKLGESYAALGRWEEAGPTYQQAIELNSTRQRPYILMGEALCQIGTPGEARFYLEQAVALGNQQEQVRQAIQYITQQGVCPP